MRSLTARQKAALRDPKTRVANFLQLGHPDGTVYAWSGTGQLTHDGVEWTGCGLVGAITGIEQGMDPRINSVGFVLAGVPGDVLNVTVTDLKGYQATIYWGILTADDEVIDDLLQIDVVDLDTQDTAAADDGTYTIVVRGQSGFWQLERASRATWSPESQKAVYPDDTGMDALHTLEDLIVTWTKT